VVEHQQGRAHPMVPSAWPEEECGGLATCACGSAARRPTAAMLWGAMGCEDKPRETGWPQRARGWAPHVPRQGAAARPRARAAAARASAWLASMVDTVVRGSAAREEAMEALAWGEQRMASQGGGRERSERRWGAPLVCHGGRAQAPAENERGDREREEEWERGECSGLQIDKLGDAARMQASMRGHGALSASTRSAIPAATVDSNF